MRDKSREYLLIFLLISLIIFGLASSPKLHGDAIPLENPITREEGYWISEEDLQASIVAAETVAELEEENEVLKEKVFKVKRREAVEVGTLAALLLYFILQLFGG